VTQPLLTSRAISSTVRTKYKYKQFMKTFIHQKTNGKTQYKYKKLNIQ